MSEPIVQHDAQLLRDFLHDRDVSCPRCEYNLRNLIGSRCPECGDELTLRVNLTEPKMGAFFTGLVGLAAGAGFSGLLLLYGLYVILILGHEKLFDRFIIVTAAGAVILGGAATFWLRGRTHIRKQPASRQWLFALSCWCLTVADLIIFTKNIR